MLTTLFGFDEPQHSGSSAVKILQGQWSRFDRARRAPDLTIELSGLGYQALSRIDRLIQVSALAAINTDLKISIIEFNPEVIGRIDGLHLDQANLESPHPRNRGGA